MVWVRAIIANSFEYHLPRLGTSVGERNCATLQRPGVLQNGYRKWLLGTTAENMVA